jgi:hypothetical protein
MQLKAVLVKLKNNQYVIVEVTRVNGPFTYNSVAILNMRAPAKRKGLLSVCVPFVYLLFIRHQS